MIINSFESVRDAGGDLMYKKGRFAAGKKLYNAIGTSGAKVRVDGTWYQPLDAWKKVFEESSETSSCPNNDMYCISNQTGEDSTELVGAHVVESDPKNKNIKVGDTYYIIPLCASCNDGKGNTTIQLKQDVSVLKLIWRGDEIPD